MRHYPNPRVEGIHTELAQDAITAVGKRDQRQLPELLVIIKMYSSMLALQIDLQWGTRELQNLLHKKLLAEKAELGQPTMPRDVADALIKLTIEHASRFGYDVNYSAW